MSLTLTDRSTFATTLVSAAEDRSEARPAAKSATQPEPKATQRLGDYELIQMLARGGMGVIFHARSLRTGAEVALKALPGGFMTPPDVRYRFNLEATTMIKLAHPGIVPVYDHGEIDGTSYFTMKLAKGGSLAEHLDDFTGHWQRIATLIARLAEVVHFAHRRGVLHRDLKPANVLLDEEENPLLCDFGVAKVPDPHSLLTLPNTSPGTPAYMSPEALRQDGRPLRPTSDVWSLGVILYQLLAGRHPFQGGSTYQVIRRIVQTEPAWLKSVPRDLAVITAKALAKNPNARYQSTGELAADLRRWLNGQPIHASVYRYVSHIVGWTRSHRALTALAAMIAIIAAALLVTANELPMAPSPARMNSTLPRSRDPGDVLAQSPHVAKHQSPGIMLASDSRTKRR